MARRSSVLVAIGAVALTACASTHNVGIAANVIPNHEIASPWPGVRETPWWITAPTHQGHAPQGHAGPVAIRLGLFGDVTFAVDTATLVSSALSQLERVLAVAHAMPDAMIVIVGYTDSDGTTAHNQQLSLTRADAVAAWLIQHGIATRRVMARGAGAADPVVPNTNAENKARNRRVEITFTNTTKPRSS